MIPEQSNVAKKPHYHIVLDRRYKYSYNRHILLVKGRYESNNVAKKLILPKGKKVLDSRGRRLYNRGIRCKRRINFKEKESK